MAPSLIADIEPERASNIFFGLDDQTAWTTVKGIVDGGGRLGAKGVNAQTGTAYTPVITDNGKIVTLTNASATTCTLPKNVTVAFPIGAQIQFIQLGAGLVTFAAESGATVVSHHTLKTLGANSVVTATKISTNGWVLDGAIALA